MRGTAVPEIIVLLASIMSVVWLFTYSYLKTQQALQWWFCSQSRQLSGEAENIRDRLLQESFVMRRAIERSLNDNPELSTQSSQEWLKTIENFHHSLVQLSDRLSPPHFEHSLPLAIEWVIQSWQTDNPRLKIETALPVNWRDESPECSITILRILAELLRIISSELLTEVISIQLSLGLLQGNLGELVVYISYPNKATLISYSDLKELKYLRQTFRFLTSGQCFCRKKDLTVTWHFRWRLPNN